MNFLSALLKSILGEVIVIFLFLFIINNYIGKHNDYIHSDGTGYYDYLPSLFIHNDINRKGKPESLHPDLYKRINTLNWAYSAAPDEHKVNKYPCGTALLTAPFFFSAYLSSPPQGEISDGYGQPYQNVVFYAAVFYLFLSLFFLKKLLALYEIKAFVIFFCQLLLALATPLTHYANMDASFSHVYSLFAITAFFYVAKAWFLQPEKKYFFYACALIALIVLLRNVNIIVLFFLPFLAGSFSVLRERTVQVIKDYKTLSAGFFIFFALVFIQLYLWHLQTGKWFVDSYPGEHFYFFNPHVFDILFSYKKGLFVYTPVLFLSLAGLFTLLFKRKYYLLLTWLFFLALLTYLLSSWHSWYYGCSFGLRAYIDFFAVFFLLFAFALTEMPRLMKPVFVFLALAAIPVNIIQTYQYRAYILHWIDMDKEKFWSVFLKTKARYNGYIWNEAADENAFRLIHSVSITEKLHVAYDENILLHEMKSSDNIEFAGATFIRVLLRCEIKEDDTRITLNIYENSDSEKLVYSHNPFLLHFLRNKTADGKYFYDFTFEPLPKGKDYKLKLLINSPEHDLEIRETEIKIFGDKKGE